MIKHPQNYTADSMQISPLYNKNDCDYCTHSILLSTFDSHLQLFLFAFFTLRVAKVLQNRFYQNIKCPKALYFQGFSGTCKPVDIIPTHLVSQKFVKKRCKTGASEGL